MNRREFLLSTAAVGLALAAPSAAAIARPATLGYRYGEDVYVFSYWTKTGDSWERRQQIIRKDIADRMSAGEIVDVGQAREYWWPQLERMPGHVWERMKDTQFWQHGAPRMFDGMPKTNLLPWSDTYGR